MNELEIQKSSEVITVTNPGFEGVGAEIIVVNSTHLKGVGWGEVFKNESEDWTSNLRKLRENYSSITTAPASDGLYNSNFS